MFNKKGITVPVFGTVLIIAAIIAFIFIGQTLPPIERSAIQKGGEAISLYNNLEFWKKSLDESIEVMAKKAAYEIAKTGGFYKVQFNWSDSYPPFDLLERELENKIKDSLPSTVKETISWGESVVDVDDYDIAPCGPITSSRCFNLKGSKNLTVYEKEIDSKISANHKFNSNVYSNYFKLLNAGRTIMEEEPFKNFLNDTGELLIEIYNAKGNGDPRFSGLDFKAYVKNETDADVVTIFIVEYCYPPDTYCLAPMEEGEHVITEELHNEGDVNYDGVIDENDEKIITDAFNSQPGSSNWNSAADITGDGIVNGDDQSLWGANVGDENSHYINVSNKFIPYDFVRLRFNYNEEQESVTLPTFNFNLEITPGAGSVKSGESIETFVYVDRMSPIDDEVDLTYSISPDPGGMITVSLDSDNQVPSFTSKMTITTSTFALAGLYFITVTGAGGGVTKSDTYALTLDPSMFFTLDINPTFKIIDLGETTTANVFVDFTGGSPSPVDLSEVNNPAGITTSFSPNSWNPDYTSVLCITDSGAGVGTHILKVRGIGGGSEDYTDNFILTIAPTFDFNINLGWYESTNIPGEVITVPSDITIENVASIPKNVIISSEVKAQSTGTDTGKVAVSFTPGSGLPTFPFNMVMTVSPDRIDDTYEITVKAEGGGQTHTKLYTLNIDIPQCYVDADCNDGNDCTGVLNEEKIDKCRNAGTLSAWCDIQNLPAGTVPNGVACGTDSAPCPPACAAGWEYRSGHDQSCYRTCDGTGRAPPTGCQACTVDLDVCALTSGYYDDIHQCLTDTYSANCPNKCSGGYMWTNGFAKTCTCYRQCANDVSCAGSCSCTPDTSETACPPTFDNYGTRTSCGTSSGTCPQKCVGGIEYFDGHSKSCDRQCADAVNCAGSCSPDLSTCTPPGDYDTQRACSFGCKDDDTRCNYGYFCEGGFWGTNEIQCISGCDWPRNLWAGYCDCSIPDQRIGEGTATPSCGFYWDCCVAWGWLGCDVCGWCLEEHQASCSEDAKCTYGRFCPTVSFKTTASWDCGWPLGMRYVDYTCNIDDQCALVGNEPTCITYTRLSWYDCTWGTYGTDLSSAVTHTASCS